MKKLKIGIIDTGIDITDSNILGKYKKAKYLQFKYDDIEDEQGHGTFVFKSIYSCLGTYNKYIEIYPIKIFNREYFTSKESLLKTLYKISQTNLNIINLSCSYESLDIKDLKFATNMLTKKGKIIIMSDNNDNDVFNRGRKLDNVIRVESDNNIKSDFELAITDRKIKANGNLYLYKYKNEYYFFGKNSRACAVATANISKLIIDKKMVLEYLDIKEIFCGLKYNGYYLTNEIHDVCEKFHPKDILKGIITIINQFSKNKITESFINKYGIRNNITNIGMHNYISFIEKVEEKFKVKILYEGISFDKISNIYNIQNIIVENLYERR